MKMKGQEFLKTLVELGNKKTTEENFYYMLEVLPPQITNNGISAFLVGEPYTHKFCKIAGKVVPHYQGYAVYKDYYMDLGARSEEYFKEFIID